MLKIRPLSWEETHAFSREPFKRTRFARLRGLAWSAFPLGVERIFSTSTLYVKQSFPQNI
jgi:hypothetical protein